MRKTALAFIFLILTGGSVFAQATKPADKAKKQEKTDQVGKAKQDKKPEKQKSGTYIKTELIRGNFGLYGYDYLFNDISIEVESHWAKQHASFAGFSVGYRKEDFSSSDYGHFINGKLFWKAEKNGFYFKPGIGAEWGKPSPRFEQTLFHYSGADLISYERISLERNAWMPVGVKNTGTLYPIFEASIGQKVGPLLFEGGAKIGYDKFGIDSFQFKNGLLTFQGLNNEYKFVPTLYMGIGVKLF